MKCTELSVFEQSCFEASSSIGFLIARSTPYTILEVTEASKRAFSTIFRRLEASERAFSTISRRQEASERAFSSIFDVRRPRGQHFRSFSTPGDLEASIFEHFRRQEASERAFSTIFDARRLRSEVFRGFSSPPVAKSQKRQASLHNCCIQGRQKYIRTKILENIILD